MVYTLIPWNEGIDQFCHLQCSIVLEVMESWVNFVSIVLEVMESWVNFVS